MRPPEPWTALEHPKIVVRLPVIEGVIRRRLLLNFRVDPLVMQRMIPARFRPKLHSGSAVAGICLIRLEQVRPRHLPGFVGVTSENAAHRVAVLWDDEDGRTREGVYIPRRDTSSWLNHLAGGRIFPGEHHQAGFRVRDSGREIDLRMRSTDGNAAVEVRASVADALPSTSRFGSLAEASAFFERGSVGYSATAAGDRLDGLRLDTRQWKVEPLAVHHVFSSWFSDQARFPQGSVAFDCGLVMRDIEHSWHGEPDLRP